MLRLLLVSLLFATPATAAVEYFHAEVAPRQGIESDATGHGNLVLDADRGEVTFEITIEGLTSPEVAAHIHRGDGQILHHLPLGATKAGVWQGLGPAEIFLLRDGQLFILIHTEMHNGGEARGDIVAGQVSNEPGSVGELKSRHANPQR